MSTTPDRVPEPTRDEGGHALQLSRGFSSLFWGMPTLAVAHAVALTGLWPTRWMMGWLLCAYLPVLLGLWRLRIVGDWTPHWRRRTGQALALALATLYLAPFLVWWSVWPLQGYFAIHAAGHYVAMVVFLASLNRLVGEVGRGWGDGAMRREAKAGIAMVVGMSTCSVAALLWMFHRAGVLEAGSATVLAQWSRLAGEARTLFLLPYAMTAYVMWRAKEGGFRRTGGGT
ncbi:MAG: hypothetical protein RBT03_03030 [Kiritimatiellia bacterium]|nr:hypothetical protein [Kiritimatiellia bacterium]